MASLITTARTKFLDAIRSVNPPQRWKILVVDEHSQKLLNTVLKQFDILEENVTLIESISSHREQQPGFEAMYILMPTTQNVDRVIRDFSNGRQQYAGAHLFFVEGLAEHLFEKIAASPAEPFLKTLQELYINFNPIEAQAFSLKMPEQFFGMFSPARSEGTAKAAKDRLEEDVRFVAKSIANVCITLNEFPYIRYYMPSHHPPLGPLKPNDTIREAPPPPEGSARWRTNLARGEQARQYEKADSEYLCKILAWNVQNCLEEYKKANSDWPKADASRGRGTLIITDRSMDTIAPFIHEFTYQAMANDLLPIYDGTKYTYKFQSSIGAYEDKTATLSDADTVWTEVRHMHMREAIDKLMADFNKFVSENAGFKGEGAANLNDMKDMLASLPQYQEQREKFSLHLNMAQECMGIFEQDKLPVVANVEQNCATGLTSEGKTPKHLVEEMVPILDSREVVNSNKVRIIALYIQYREGVPDEDRRRLYQHARLTMAEQDAVNALVHLGVRISRGPADKDVKKRLKQKPTEDEEYDLSRFKPLVRTVISEQVSNKLDQALFPYVKDYPSAMNAQASLRGASGASPASTPPASLRSAKPSWHRAARPNASQETRQRLFFFMAGGMTYSEMREAYQLSSSLSKDIYIGSTHTFTPKQFVDDLKVLELNGVGSKAIPNGIREARNGQRPYQDYYDELYFTQDAPAPAPARPPPSNNSKMLRPAATPMSLTPSGGSQLSVNSMGSGVSGKVEKEKKKKGLFKKW
ncbi:Sec1-like snare protein [Stereum hirsutum FP-91666 SS1]|uniref:Sec1-like snare protein n=1 Tax=Stereum hirsutum (strain FP-91666) TaxID=721885 RepID=UPI000444A882|nr:Sec1-like snare protein [Stereum hirsutum FP-91666 SS1]EIM86902.1 Sec1-like snare protein [Stereum hirsutum FP-91666 SS1]